MMSNPPADLTLPVHLNFIGSQWNFGMNPKRPSSMSAASQKCQVIILLLKLVFFHSLASPSQVSDLSLEKSLFTLSWYVIELFCCKQQAKGGPSVFFFFNLPPRIKEGVHEEGRKEGGAPAYTTSSVLCVFMRSMAHHHCHKTEVKRLLVAPLPEPRLIQTHNLPCLHFCFGLKKCSELILHLSFMPQEL